MASKALQLSKNDVQALVKRAESLQNRVKKVKDHADKVVETAIRTSLVGGTALGFGVLQGKFGGIEIFGMPVELLTGVGGHLAGFLGVGGKATPMLHHVADGALAAWLTTLGRGLGKNWSTKASGAVKGDVLNDDEMEKISKQQG